MKTLAEHVVEIAVNGWRNRLAELEAVERCPEVLLTTLRNKIDNPEKYIFGIKKYGDLTVKKVTRADKKSWALYYFHIQGSSVLRSLRVATTGRLEIH